MNIVGQISPNKINTFIPKIARNLLTFKEVVYNKFVQNAVREKMSVNKLFLWFMTNKQNVKWNETARKGWDN